MGRNQDFRSVISLAMGILLLSGQFAFSMEPSVAVLGDVVGKGTTEMKTAFGKWISVSDKAYPLVDGANLRSGEGGISSIFRDGARMEIGKNSEVIVTGSKGNYTVDLKKGKLAFSVPGGINFSLITPTSGVSTQLTPNIIQKVSTASLDYVRGIIVFDGKGTTVTAVSGTLMVKDAKGVAAYTVAAGNSVYISETESGHRAVPAQLADVRTGGNPNPGSVGENPGISPFAVVGGAVLLEGGAYLLVKSANKTKGGVASPSSP